MEQVTLAGKIFAIERYRLKKWLELEEIRAHLSEAVDTKDISDCILRYVSTAFGIDTSILAQEFWFDIVRAFVEICAANQPSRDYRILHTSERKSEDTMDYDGRLWYSWCHLFAKNYGWKIEEIANMKIDDAIALLQEIMIDNYYEREWDWSLSEHAYTYDTITKKSIYNPLPKPTWMLEKSEKKTMQKGMKDVKIPHHMIPVGIIILGPLKDGTK